MFPRYLVAVCVLAFVVAINADEAPGHEEVFVEPRNPALALAARWIAKELGKRAAKCALEAAQACESNWNHFHALIKCAKEFAKNNKGRCLA